MGALTLKSFPFEVRGWDIEKFESIDPTDGFGTNTRVYISKQQVLQIEPDHTEITSNTWLSDKGRQFFDGIFNIWAHKNNPDTNFVLKKKSWQKTIQILLKTLYLFEHCATKTKTTYFFTIVFENLGIETLSLLKMIEQKYSFVKLRRAENLNLSNNLESSFQLNTATNLNRLKYSTLCLLIASNSRYEGYHLNLNLRQRFLKGNFKCLKLGSHINLTFPTSVIGTNTRVLKNVAEGNNFLCQDFKTATNPLVIFSNDFYKRIDGKNAVKMLKHANLFNRAWNGLNTLSSTLAETGIQTVAHFLPLKKKDLDESSLFYFINLNAHNVPNLMKITEALLLNYITTKSIKQPSTSKLFLDQNSNIKNNQAFVQTLSQFENTKNYRFLPVKMFYENEETFLNTEGLFKRTHKVVTKRKTKDNWKLLRNLLNYFKGQYNSLSFKDIVSFNAIKQTSFSNFVNFHYCAIEKLDNFIPSLTFENQPFFINQKNVSFKQKPFKILNTKSKYWLDDFFTGGKDEYTKNSLVLSNCSKLLRTQSTNFF